MADKKYILKKLKRDGDWYVWADLTTEDRQAIAAKSWCTLCTFVDWRNETILSFIMVKHGLTDQQAKERITDALEGIFSEQLTLSL